MKKADIDQYRTAWHSAVASMRADGNYANEIRADEFFLTVVAPLWQLTLNMKSVPIEKMDHALGVTMTMKLMLRLFAVAVLGRRPAKGDRSKPPRFACWPPYVTGEGVVFVESIPKGDIARIVGKTDAAVKRALDGFRGKKGKAGLALYEKRLVFPAPFATGIILDGAFEQQMSLPFGYAKSVYNHIQIYNTDQRREQGMTATQAIEWGKAGVGSKVGTPVRAPSIDRYELAPVVN
ncbi:MAG: hypothetical protein WC563_15650 [Brevundimonas sp.]